MHVHRCTCVPATSYAERLVEGVADQGLKEGELRSLISIVFSSTMVSSSCTFLQPSSCVTPIYLRSASVKIIPRKQFKFDILLDIGWIFLIPRKIYTCTEIIRNEWLNIYVTTERLFVYTFYFVFHGKRYFCRNKFLVRLNIFLWNIIDLFLFLANKNI